MARTVLRPVLRRLAWVAAPTVLATVAQLATVSATAAATPTVAVTAAAQASTPALLPADPPAGNTGPLGGAAFGVVSAPAAGDTTSSVQPSVSSDGHFVAYTSGTAVYVEDTVSGAHSRIDVSNSGAAGDRQSFAPAISGDGRYVAFTSWARNLVADGSDDGVFQRDTVSGTTVRVSVDAAGDAIYGDPVNNTDENGPAISADGRHVAFVLDNPDCDNHAYDIDNPWSKLAPDGGDGWVWDRSTGRSVRLPGCVARPAISADGTLIAYEVLDEHAVPHVYGWDVAVGAEIGALSFDTAGDLIAGSSPSVSADGRSVAFVVGINADGSFGTADGDVLAGAAAVRDRAASLTTVVPHPRDDPRPSYSPFFYLPDLIGQPQISADGRYVAYSEDTQNLCTGAIGATGSYYVGLGEDLQSSPCGLYSAGVFVADMTTRRYARQDLDLGLTPLRGRYAYHPSASGEPAISADAHYVAFANAGYAGLAAGVYLRDRTQTPVIVPSGELRGSDPFCPVCHSAVTRLDPINTATGAYQRQDNDISLNGNGVNFSLQRDYSSDELTTGLFGAGWSANLTSSLAVLASGDAQVTAGTGAVVVFTRQLDGSYAAPPEVRATLASLPSGGWQIISASQMLTTYDSSGRMATQVDRNNQGLSYGYNGSGRVSTVTDSTGRVATIGYGSTGAATGMIVDVTLADGRAWRYTYQLSAAAGAAPLLTTVTDAAGAVTTYAYDAASSRLTSIVDSNGHTIASIGYGASGVDELTEAANTGDTHGSYSWNGTSDGGTARTTDANGGVWTDVYVGNNLISATDPLGNTTQYRYDDRNNQTAVIDAIGAVTSSTFDDNGNRLTETDPLSNTTTYTYDADNHMLSQIDPLGHLTTYIYDANGNRTSETDAAGGVTRWTYTASGQQATETDPLGHATSYTYDTAGNQLTKTDPLGHPTTFTYDTAGNQLTETDPLGHVTHDTYDAVGRLLSETDPMGRISTYTYDSAGNKTSTTTASGTLMAATTTYAYDAANRLLTTTDPLGRVTSNAYDAVGNLISSTDPAGDVTTTRYDAANHKIGLTAPLGNISGGDRYAYTTIYTMDALGRQIQTDQPLANQNNAVSGTEYDAAGRVMSSMDANGNTTTTTYDADGNTTQVSDPTGAVTAYGYDALGRKITVTDPLSRTTTYSYDAAGNQTSVTDPAGGKTTDIYDPAGQKTSEVSPNGNAAGANPADFTTTFSYDAAGNQTAVTDPLGHASRTAYNADNEKASSTDPTGAVTGYGYDAAGNQTVTTYPDASTITDGYNLAGNKTSTTDKAGHASTFGYDAAGRMTSTTDPVGAVTAYDYDADGNQTTVTSPNGGVTTSTYNQVGWLRATVAPTGAATYYEYNLVGQRVDVDDPDGNLTAYEYDPAGRLTATIQPDGTTATSSYDAAGQLLSYTVPYNPAPGATPTQTVAGPAAPPSPPDPPTADGGSGAGGTPAAPGLGNPYPTAVLADAPAIYYRLGDPAPATTAADSSGNSRDGVNAAVTLGAPGALLNESDTSGALAGGEVHLASGAGLPVGNASRSIETWFKTVDSAHQVLTWWGSDAPNEEMELGVDGGNQIYLTGQYNEARFTTTATFADNAWHHLVLSYDGPTKTVVGYLDGQTIGSQVLGDPWNTVNDATGLTVGGPEYQGYFFAGSLDEVAIYPTALTAGQIEAHYAASGRQAAGTPGSVGAVAFNPGDNSVAASWNPPTDGGAVGYYQITAVTDDHETLSTTVPASATTAVLTGLVAGPTYLLRVTAVNSHGAGPATDSYPFNVNGTTGSYAQQVLADNPALYYRLSDAAGSLTAADSSGNNHPAANSNATFSQPGALATDTDTSAGFTGAELHETSGTGLPVGNASRSIETWFKTADNAHQIITWWGNSSPNQQMELGTDGGNQIYLTGQYNEARFTTATSFADNAWHHLVLTYDGSSKTVVGYLDGEVIGSQVLGDGWNTINNATGLTVGGPEYQGYFFHGNLDDVAIYPTALTPARVLAHYSAARLPGLSTTSYTYTAAGQRATETDPDGHTTSYVYDAAGNAVTTTDAMSRVTTSAYDHADRLIGITYSDTTTPNVTYAYDAAGRRMTMADGTGTSTYAYDSSKQLTVVADGAGHTVTYSYDSLGRIAGITYPDGHSVVRGYDSANRLTSVTDWTGNTTAFGYDANGNHTTTTYPNGLVQVSSVDAADQTTGVEIHSASGSLATFDYTLTPAGRVVNTTDSVAPTTDDSYGFSQNGRLVSHNGNPNAYTYDGAGNVNSLDNGTAQSYDAAGQLSSAIPRGGARSTYAFDVAGDRTSATGAAGTTTLAYDQAHRLTLYHSDAASIGFQYDGDGMRTASIAATSSLSFVWDQASGRLPLLLSDSTNEYLYGPDDEVVEQLRSSDGAISYLNHDRLGSTRLLMDSAGSIVRRNTYDAYGQLIATSGTASSPFGYSGQYLDPTGLLYLRARYYDTATAQFLTVDPQLAATRQPFSYAGGDPFGYVDPSGAARCLAARLHDEVPPPDVYDVWHRLLNSYFSKALTITINAGKSIAKKHPHDKAERGGLEDLVKNYVNLGVSKLGQYYWFPYSDDDSGPLGNAGDDEYFRFLSLQTTSVGHIAVDLLEYGTVAGVEAGLTKVWSKLKKMRK